MITEKIISLKEFENGEENPPQDDYVPIYKLWFGGRYVAYYEGKRWKAKLSPDFSEVLESNGLRL